MEVAFEWGSSGGGEDWVSRAVRYAAVVAAAALATGCAGASHQAAAPAPVSVPGATTTGAVAQLGIDVYWHTPGSPSSVSAAAAPILDYVTSLHANSVALAFPIFTDGDHPTRVYTDPASTPDPATLRVLIDAAKGRGLRVAIRPIIDEANIATVPGRWRGSIVPADTGAWFASYRSVLDPYLGAAQAAHADEFVLGTELNSLIEAPQWQDVQTDASSRFHGVLSYADNWDAWVKGRAPKAISDIGLDAYPPFNLPDSASVDRLTASWTAWLRQRSVATLQDTVIQEVGIPAQSGAYRIPYSWGTGGAAIDPEVQQKWFAAACQSARSLGMAGLYYWSVSSTDPMDGHSDSPGSFVGRGDSAVKACFASPWKVG